MANNVSASNPAIANLFEQILAGKDPSGVIGGSPDVASTILQQKEFWDAFQQWSVQANFESRADRELTNALLDIIEDQLNVLGTINQTY